MKKDYIKDYATEAFRFYAKKGKPTYEEMEKQIRIEAERKNHTILGVSTNTSDPTLYELLWVQNVMDEREAELLDILAVSKVMRILTVNKYGNFIKKAIDMVYFQNPFKELERNEISSRVANASLRIPCSERQVYRYLKSARDLFAFERKLRIPLKELTLKTENKLFIFS